MLRKVLSVCFAAAFVALVGLHERAAANASIVVTTTSDTLNTDGVCSLREAIIAANTDTAVDGCAAGSGEDTITFAVSGVIVLADSLPEIAGHLTITGPGLDQLTINGQFRHTAFKIASGHTVNLSGLRLIANAGEYGGALFNEGGVVSLNDMVIQNSRAQTAGAAVYNTGTLDIHNTRLINNQALDSADGIVWNSGALSLFNTLFSGNYGYSLSNQTGSVNIINSTLRGGADYGSIANADGTIHLQNTVIYHAVDAPNCANTGTGTLVSVGYNLDDQAVGSCGFHMPNDLPNGTDPLLSPVLRWFTVETWSDLETVLLLPMPGSPLIDAGSDAGCALAGNRDHRGEQRPLDGDGDSLAVCDIGAFERRVEAIPQSEHDALLALYTGTGLDAPGWPGPAHPCSWQGVICRDGHVVELHLGHIASFSGALPAELGDLSALIYLDVSGNAALAALPPELGSLTQLMYLSFFETPISGGIPPELGSLLELEHLNFGFSGLSGEIPASLGNLNSLRTLNLSFNALTGTIPPELGSLTALHVLALEGNTLSGGIPGALGGLSALRWLSLGENPQLGGSLPPELANLTHLEALRLHAAAVSGTIPPQLGQLRYLRELLLFDNQLTGTIPPELGALPSLVRLALAGNQLTGTIPAQLGDLSVLETLLLDNNRLTGTIPGSLSQLSRLNILLLNSNRLSGTIPPGLGGLPLRYFHVAKNQLSGEIPLAITGLASLSEDGNGLDLGYNALYSSSPEVMAFLDTKDPDWAETQTVAPQNLTTGFIGTGTVDLHWQPVAYTGDAGYYEVYYAGSAQGPYVRHGITPDKSSSGYTVNSLLLGTTYYFKVRTFTPTHPGQQNQLYSDFTPVISATTTLTNTFCQNVTEIVAQDCEALVTLYSTTNGASWTARAGWLSSFTPCAWFGVSCDGTRVSSLALSHNSLNGSLPPQLGDLTALQQLDLAGNGLFGALPPELGALTQMTVLDLSANQLNGTLPPQLGSLTALQHLKLSDNLFSGALPGAWQNLTSLQTLTLMDNHLSGALPAWLGSLNALDVLALGGNTFSGAIPPELGSLSQLTHLDLSANLLSGNIPLEIGALNSLVSLNLHQNQLTGAFPAQLLPLPNLTVLTLGKNQLGGALPLEIGMMNGLIALGLDYNAFSGEIPESILQMTGLGVGELALDYNALYTASPEVAAFVTVYNPGWDATQTVPPLDVQVSQASVDTIALVWTPILFSQGDGRYEVFYATDPEGPFTQHGSTANKSITVYALNGLQPATTYYLKVRTYSRPMGSQQNALTSDFGPVISATTSATGINAPSNLSAAALSQTEIILQWTDNADDEDAFLVERSLNGFSDWAVVGVVGQNTMSHTDTELVCNISYYYRVRAYRADGDEFSAYSGTAAAQTHLCPPPEAPSQVTTHSLSLTQIRVDWLDNSPDEQGFSVEHSPNGQTGWAQIVLVDADTTTYTHGGLGCGQTHYYRVRAYRAQDGQYSAFSPVVTGSTQMCPAPNAPTLVSASGVAINQIALAWLDNSADETGFAVESSPNGVTDWQQIALLPANTTSYVHGGLRCATAYYYRVRAVRLTDQQVSLYSAVLSASTFDCLPPVIHTVGLYKDGLWVFRDSNSSGAPDVVFIFGPQEPGWIPLVGDWDGDGIDGIGLYKDGYWLLRNSASSGMRDLAFSFNPLGAGALPVAGDWNGDGIDTIGVYKDGRIALRNENSDGSHHIAFMLDAGSAGWLPVAGDWDGDGIDSIGIYRDGKWYLHNQLSTPARPAGFDFGPVQAGWLPVAGDWDEDGRDTVGLYKDGLWRLRNANTSGGADIGFSFTPGGAGWKPIAGYRGGLAGLGSLGLGDTYTLPTPFAPPAPTATETPTAPPEITAAVESALPEATESVPEATAPALEDDAEG